MISKLNTLLEMERIGAGEIREINSCLETLKKSEFELMTIHNEFSMKALKNAYAIIDDLVLSSGVKEHIVWYYYDRIHLHKREATVQDTLDQLITDYKKYQFVALDSIVISMLRDRQLSREQIEMINQTFDNKAVLREIANIVVREQVDLGHELDVEEVIRLLEWRAFGALGYALDRGMISSEALPRFEYPDQKDYFRKVKLSLHEKAQRLLENRQSKET